MYFIVKILKTFKIALMLSMFGVCKMDLIHVKVP